MPWHYEREGRTVGPFDDAEMIRLAEGGRIDAISLVSRDGGRTWISSREAAPLLGLDPDRLQSGEAGPIGRCSSCAVMVGADELSSVGGLLLCSACLAKLPKPIGPSSEGTQRRQTGLWARLRDALSGKG